MVERIEDPHEPVNIALVGKYVELEDAYYSVREALRHAALYHNRAINMIWVHSEETGKRTAPRTCCASAQGIIVPGGFGNQGHRGHDQSRPTMPARNKIPYLGLCLGMQVMVIEFARHALQCA